MADAIAESSPAPEAPVSTPEAAPATAEPSVQERLNSLTGEQRTQWRLTGEFPSSEPDKAKGVESEPAKPTSESAKLADATAPESEPGKTTEEKKQLTVEERSARDQKRNDRKWTLINRQLGETNAELRRLREENAALKQSGKPESQPGRAEAEPQLEEFETIDAYKTALKAFERKQARSEFEREQRQSKAQSEVQTARGTWQTKVAKFVKGNPEADFEGAFEHVRAAVDTSSVSEVVTTAVLESEFGPEIIDYLAEHDEELEALTKASKYGAGKIISRIEDTLSGKPKSPPTPNPKDVLKAQPSPPADIRGRSGPVEDPLEAARKNGDFRTIKRIENERDIARMKRGS